MPEIAAYLAVFAGTGLVTAVLTDASLDRERRKPGPEEIHPNSRRAASTLFLATADTCRRASGLGDGGESVLFDGNPHPDQSQPQARHRRAVPLDPPSRLLGNDDYYAGDGPSHWFTGCADRRALLLRPDSLADKDGRRISDEPTCRVRGMHGASPPPADSRALVIVGGSY